MTTTYTTEHRTPTTAWRFSVNSTETGDLVWLCIEAGGLSGGLFLPLDKAHELAQGIGAAHADALRRAEKLAEAKAGLA